MDNLIEITDKWNLDLDGFLFCIRALNLKDRRTHITHLLIRNGYAYGTDSRRLHRCKLQGKYKNGLYRVFKHLKRHLILMKTDKPLSDYPKLNKLFSGKSNKVFTSGCGKDDYIYMLTFIIRALSEERSINPEFLKDLDFYGECHIFRDKIIIKDGNRAAVIMPFKN